MLGMDRTCVCERCGATFESEWSEEEALAEACANFAPEWLADTATVCDACYALFMAWYRSA
jgi:hypothetical protein